MRSIRIVCYLLVLTLFGCDQAGMIKKLTPPEDEIIARHYIELLRQRNFEQIEKDLSPSLKGPNIRKTLFLMAEKIPSGQELSSKIVGMNSAHRDDESRTNIIFEYEFPGKWLVINLETTKRGKYSNITGFHVNPIPDSLENLNRFTFAGKTVFQYFIFAMVFMIPIFSTYVLVICIRAKPEKHRLFWIIFIILGMGKLTVDWGSGQWNFNPLSVQLLGVSALTPTYWPWKFSVSLPLGALLFLLDQKMSKTYQEDEIVETSQ